MSSVPFFKKTPPKMFYYEFSWIHCNSYSIESICNYAFMMRCTILYHLYNLKNVKNIHGGV